MRYISMDQAKPGMIVGKSVFNEEGKILVNYKVCLTEKLIGQMKEKKLQGLYINDELSKDININPLSVRNWSSVPPKYSTTWILMRHWKWQATLQKS